MADNVTTVPGLPDADFEKHPLPEENLLYIVQGTGADRDRKAATQRKILSGGAALFFATSDGTYPYQQVIGG